MPKKKTRSPHNMVWPKRSPKLGPVEHFHFMDEEKISRMERRISKLEQQLSPKTIEFVDQMVEKETNKM